MRSSLRCERQVVATPELAGFVAMSRVQATEVFGVKDIIMVDVSRGTYLDQAEHDYMPITVEKGEHISASAMKSTLYSIEGEASTSFNHLLDNAARRITADKIRGSSRGAKKPTGGKTYEYRLNTLTSELNGIEEEMARNNNGALYAPVAAVIRAHKARSSSGQDVYALKLESEAGMSRVLTAQQIFLDETLRQYVSVRNAVKMAENVKVNPLVIPFARIPHLSERVAIEYTSRLTKTIASAGMHLVFHAPEWRLDTIYT